MSECREIKLGDIVSSNNQSIDKNYLYKIVQYLDTGSITNEKIDGFQKFDITKAPSRAKRLVKHEDIIYSTVRPIQRHFGFIEKSLDNLVVSTGFSVIETNQKLAYPKFIYYFLSSDEIVEELDIIAEASTTTYPSLKPKDIEKFPPLKEQKAIAKVLSSLDDKIDLLHRQNKTLEELAQTLFRQWFIEEAKDKWEVGKVPDEFNFTMGLSPKGETFNEEGMGTPMYQGNADFEFRFPKNRVYTTDPKRYAEKFDTLISVRAPVGAQNMAKEKCCIGRGVASFRYKADSSFYTYTYFKMMSLMNEIKQFNDCGTVFGSINKTDFQNMKIIIPPTNLVVKYQDEVKPLDDKVIQNTFQIKTLENMRDTLLLKLMSSDVRVKL